LSQYICLTRRWSPVRSRAETNGYTKFGLDNNGEITLGDEALTPDSSRFWDTTNPGTSFDKQFVRDYLTSSGWDKKSPPPELPAEIIEKTAQRYHQAYYTITGSKF